MVCHAERKILIILMALSSLLIGCNSIKCSYSKDVDFYENGRYAFTVIRNEYKADLDGFSKEEKLLVVIENDEAVILNVNRDTTGDNERTLRTKISLNDKDVKYLHRCSDKCAYNYLKNMLEPAQFEITRRGIAFDDHYLSYGAKSPEDEYLYYIENGIKELLLIEDVVGE